MKRLPVGRRPHTVHDHTRDEAILWFISFCEDEIDANGRERFERWLKASPEHVQAYLQVSALWEAVDRLSASCKVGIEELAGRAAAETNVVELEPPAPLAAPASRGVVRLSALRRSGAIAASLVVVGLLSSAGLWWQRHRSVVYETGIGDQRTLTLADLSTVQLDALSKIRVHFTKNLRVVELLKGQALFRVTHNAARPFIVRTDDASVRDVGTQFDVSRYGTATVVTVLGGQVAAFDAPIAWAASPSGAGGVFVSAGEQVTLEPHTLLRLVHVNAAMVTAWTQGKLIFDDTPLSQVVEIFNRYNPKRLTIDDPQLLSLHVSGTFDTFNSMQIVRFLTQRFGLVAHESADGIWLSRG